MKGNKIDDKDLKILELLTQNSRVSYSDISKELGIKSPSIIERVKNLENKGIIKDYGIELDYSIIGFETEAFIGVTLSKGININEFEKRIGQEPFVTELIHMTGDYDLFIRVVAKSNKDLSGIVQGFINSPDVSHTSTFIHFKSDKKSMNIINNIKRIRE